MEWLVPLFAVGSLPWTLPLVRSGRLLAFASIVLLAGVVFGPRFYAFDGPVQLSLNRILFVTLAGLFAIRWRLGEVRFDRPVRADWLLIAFAFWLLIRAVGTEVPLGGTPPVAKWLTFIAMPLGMYLVARFAPAENGDLRWFADVLIALAAYLSITGLFEVQGWYALVFPRYIVNPEHWEFYGRARGPLLNPIGNGIAITAGMVAAVLRGFHAPSRAGRLVFACAACVMAVGLAATLTRSVWLGGAAACAIVALVHLPRWARVIGLAAAILVGGVFAIGLKDELLRLKRDRHVSAADAAKSVKLRPLLAVVAWEMFRDRPLAGHGYGGYFKTSPPYHAIRDYDLALDEVRPYMQHNVLLSLVVDAGLIGLSLLAVWLTVIGGIAWTLAHAGDAAIDVRSHGLVTLGLLATYLSNGMFHDVNVIPMVSTFLCFTAGIAVNVWTRRERPVDGRQAGRRSVFAVSR